MEKTPAARRWVERLAYPLAAVFILLTMQRGMIYLAFACLCIGATIRKDEPGRCIYLAVCGGLALLAIAYQLDSTRMTG